MSHVSFESDREAFVSLLAETSPDAPETQKLEILTGYVIACKQALPYGASSEELMTSIEEGLVAHGYEITDAHHVATECADPSVFKNITRQIALKSSERAIRSKTGHYVPYSALAELALRKHRFSIDEHL